MQTFKDLFPEFAWVAGADDFHEELQSKRPTLIEQLRQRKIARTEVKPLLFPGGCRVEKERFIIVFDDQSTLQEKFKTLGHEIGHTFHYDLTSTKLILLCPEARISEKVFDRVEEFCKIFAERWLKLNSIDQIPEIID